MQFEPKLLAYIVSLLLYISSLLIQAENGTESNEPLMSPLAELVTQVTLPSRLLPESDSISSEASLLTLSLDKNINNKCLLVIDGFDSIDLDLEAPCYFFVNQNTKRPPDQAYNKLGIQAVILIGGDQLTMSPTKKSYLKLSQSKYCTQSVQALLIAKKGWALSFKQDNTHACSDSLLDEKLYYALVQLEKKNIQLNKKSLIHNQDDNLFYFFTEKIKAFFN